jgi:hypothetical protein
MSFLSRLFGGRLDEAPEVVLRTAVAAVAGEAMATRAMDFFHDPGAFVAWLEARHQCPDFVQDEREPSPAELAWEVWFHLLSEHGYACCLDWKDGLDGIVEAFDGMFALQGAPAWRLDELARLCGIAAASEPPGGPYMDLWDSLHAAARERGLALEPLDLGNDGHCPLVFRAEHRALLRDARFGKGYPLLP